MTLRIVTGLKIKLGILALVGATLSVQPYRPMVFVGKSMSPTYADHTWAITGPVTKPIRPGDVVVVNTDDGPIVKRVAFVGGDRIPQIQVGKFWQDVVDLEVSANTIRHLKSEFRYRTLPKGQVYVLGDNRTDSIDSRIFGSVSENQIARVLVNPLPRKTVEDSPYVKPRQLFASTL